MAATVSAISETTRIYTRFDSVRTRTLYLCRGLTAEDMMVQSCAEASPAKWHLAHTAWFFESFVLREFLPGYQVFNEDFAWLFNSYYQSFTAFPEKRLRASFSRPPLDEVLRYRTHVDEGVRRLLENGAPAEALRRIELGLNHEEQHQELLLTDILHAFFTNPLKPAYLEGNTEVNAAETSQALEFVRFDGGLREVGHGGGGFGFDNEMPRHKTWLEPYRLATRLVTCEEFAEFMADGGYSRAELWLSAGWDAVQREAWRAPLYWSEHDGEWRVFTLRGEQTLEALRSAPVSHVSYFEADAYARWAGYRLPTEFEWEAAVEGSPVEGNLLESGRLVPVAEDECARWFGNCWQWTASAYLGYPGFQPLPGSLGEYNGKFMSGQMVLRGGSCVTPRAHIRSTYRNFFSPETRWQFSGIRLAAL
ncbi:MAG: ergothioneine biosynthesis protein EgtB [Acidobacteriota bacterium]|nr:ergothioneine biosynthesis protein EgtB [Acidobacteriota bacterium]